MFSAVVSVPSQNPSLPAPSPHALKHRPDSPQTAGSQWQRLCLFQRDCVLTQKGLFGWSNNPSMIKLLLFGQIKDYKDEMNLISCVCVHLRVQGRYGRYESVYKYIQIWCRLVLNIQWHDKIALISSRTIATVCFQRFSKITSLSSVLMKIL